MVWDTPAIDSTSIISVVAINERSGDIMRAVTPIAIDILNSFAAVDENAINEMLAGQLSGLNKKTAVLDDDPTGVQTVHHISVYTDWQPETMV